MEAVTAEEAKKAWGLTLARARRDAGLYQSDIASAVGVDQTTVSYAERGFGRLETYTQIANYLGVQIVVVEPAVVEPA